MHRKIDPMYASSLVISMKEIKERLKKTQSYSDFNNPQLLSIGLNTSSVIKDWVIQLGYAIKNLHYDPSFCENKSSSVNNLLEYMYNTGSNFDEKYNSDELEENSNRINRVDGGAWIPINSTRQGVKNWHQVLRFIYTKLPDIMNLSKQIHQRSTTADRDLVEIVYWTMQNKLDCLYHSMNKVNNIQQHILQYFNKNLFRDIDTIEEIAISITEVNSNA